MNKTGIIGGAGYIGSYITKTFLENGYRLKVSTTDISNKRKYVHLENLPNASRLEITETNILEPDSLKSFVAGCDILIHSGTPFQLDVEDPQKDLFEPTVNGTENVLNIIRQVPSIKKVVMLSSVAAYNTSFPLPAENRSPDHLYTEEDAPFMHEENHHYSHAKFYADQIVREFMESHPENGFEIVSLYPTFAVGKPLSGRQDSTSVGLQYMFKNHLAPNSFMEMLYKENVELAMVDVSDIAKAAFKAATTDGLHGRNYFLSSESWTVSDISRILNKEEPVDKPRTVYSNSLASRDLGVEFTSPQVSLNQFENE